MKTSIGISTNNRTSLHLLLLAMTYLLLTLLTPAAMAQETPEQNVLPTSQEKAQATLQRAVENLDVDCEGDELCEAILDICEDEFLCVLMLRVCSQNPDFCMEILEEHMPECDEQEEDCEAPSECNEEQMDCDEPAECNEDEMNCEEPSECNEEQIGCEEPADCNEEDMNCDEPTECNEGEMNCEEPTECNEEQMDCEEAPDCNEDEGNCEEQEEETEGDNEGDTGNDGGHGDGHDGGHGSGTNHQHSCMMTPDFTDISLMTHTAAQSGAWSDSATWGGNIPGSGAIVQIPEGIEVSIARVLGSRLETVRIDGTLTFAHNQHTELKVDTLFSSCSGHLQIGNSTTTIQPDVSARIVFIDDGPVNDARLLSRGAILMGKTTIYGTPKTHRAIISPHARQGDTAIKLSSAPAGWQIDDELIITGTLINDPTSDEIRNIRQLNGTQITLDSALSLDHTAPEADLNVYVANSSRNVEFISENPAVDHRGHIMFMSLDVDVQNVRFTELGRTDKTRPLDDFQFNFHDGGSGDDAPATADVIPLGGRNVRGRYAIHFHQSGVDPSSTPALVKGSVVFNGPGWGFVNHSSHVDFIDNVSYGLQGAGFYTEAGNEIGRMQGNIAIRSVNSSFTLDDQGAIDPDLSANFMDYGNDGDGFWLTGNRVSMIDNVAAGASAHGIIYWTDGIMEPANSTTTRVTVPVADLPNGDLIPNRTAIPVWWAPLAENRGNESYGSTVGFRIRYVHARNYLGREEESDFHRSPPQAYIDTLTPTINNLTVWGSRDGVLLNYNERMNLSGARIVGFGKDISQFSFNPGTAKSGVGLDVGNDATHGPAQIDNITISGFGMALVTPVNGLWQLGNITLRDNNTDMLIQPPETEPTQVNLQNVQFQTFEVVDGDNSAGLPGHIVVQN